MLDAHPAPAVAARPPVAVPSPAVPSTASPSRPSALLAAAAALLPVLEAGRALDAPALRQAMTAAFGASDAEGGWVWKDAYEAAEAALVLFIQRYGRAMRREAGAGPGGPAAMLGMLETLAALEPSQTRRSEEQLRLQQFSTPLPLAYAALQAAAIRPGDVVLDPSAGTGMLAVMAACALRPQAAGSLRGAKLKLIQTIGGSSSGGADVLLSRTTLDGLAANGNGEGGNDDLKSRRLELRLGYGFSAFGDRFTWTPEVGVGLSDTGRDYSLGWRLVRGGSGGDGGSLELYFEARRRESANDNADPEHMIVFKLGARF